MSRICVPAAVVDRTLLFLREAGASRNSEGVVLWLGSRLDGEIAVQEAFIPEQTAAEDFFRIPPEGMAALLQHLGKTRAFVASQVHSHPREAFHSYADDKWAIVRHAGALSIVVPQFARATSADNFIESSAAFCLSPGNAWDLVQPEDLRRVLRIV